MLAGLLPEALAATNRATGAEVSQPANTFLELVACVSAGNCSAVGDYYYGESNFHGLLLTETSGRWSTGVQPALPANASTTPDARLNAVSCVPAGNCTAGGGYVDSSGHDRGLLLTVRSR
jgi:hypothetical protein